MEAASNEMETQDVNKMTPEELKVMQERIERSRADFDKRNTINGMTVHFFSAMLNGLYSDSNIAGVDDGDINSLYERSRAIADMAFNSNQAYLDEGVQQFNDEVQ